MVGLYHLCKQIAAHAHLPQCFLLAHTDQRAGAAAASAIGGFNRTRRKVFENPPRWLTLNKAITEVNL